MMALPSTSLSTVGFSASREFPLRHVETWPAIAYCLECEIRFSGNCGFRAMPISVRFDGDRDSDVMPITIPG